MPIDILLTILVTATIQSIFGVFLNLVIEFQRITIGIKDLIGKGWAIKKIKNCLSGGLC